MLLNKNEFTMYFKNQFKNKNYTKEQINNLYEKYKLQSDEWINKLYKDYVNLYGPKTVCSKKYSGKDKSGCRKFELYVEKCLVNRKYCKGTVTSSEPRYAAQKIYTRLCRNNPTNDEKCKKIFSIIEINKGNKPGKIFNYLGYRKKIDNKTIKFNKNNPNRKFYSGDKVLIKEGDNWSNKNYKIIKNKNGKYELENLSGIYTSEQLIKSVNFDYRPMINKDTAENREKYGF